MTEVDIRWRPSGGRGEYEHVPSEVLLDRRVRLAIPGHPEIIETDVTCTIRDKKPRLRREEPNNRTRLNIPPLVCALALLPEPRRDRNTPVSANLDNGFVAEQIKFRVVELTADTAVIEPVALKVRGIESPIDLGARYRAIAQITNEQSTGHIREGLLELLALSGWPGLDEAKGVTSKLREALAAYPELMQQIDAPTGALTAPSPAATDAEQAKSKIESAPTIPTTLSAAEAKERYRTHRVLERSKKLRDAKIEHHLAAGNLIACEACGFDFAATYGDLGDGYIEVHHRVPLAELPPNVVTTVNDLALLCANCHRMAHRKRKTLSVEQIRIAIANAEL